MIERLVDCPACACLVRADDAACPFCGAVQRRTGAPLWAAASLVCGLGLVDVACEEAGRPTSRAVFASSTSTDSDASGTDATGTSLPTTGSGASSTGGSGTGSETGSGTDGATTTIGGGSSEAGTSVGTGEFTSANASMASEFEADSAAYGSSPGDWPGMEPTEGAAGSSGASSLSSGGTTTPGGSLEDGCGCTSRARSGFAAGWLMVLLMRRRRSRSRRDAT